MPNTLTVPISDTDWTEVQQGVSGLITNDSSDDIRLREAATKPAADITTGHVIHPQEDMTYGVEGSQKIFARANKPGAIVIVTEG